MNKVSVIIPAYNAEKFIKECAQSVLAQTYSNLEVIIVNDGSNDSTERLVMELKEADDRVKLLTIKNSGRAAARNRGIEIAEGYWLAFLDADDYWREDKLEIQLDIASKESSDLVYSNRTWIDENGRVNETTSDGALPEGNIFPALIEGNYLCTSSVLVKSAPVRLLGGFDESATFKNCQDYDLWIRLSCNAMFSASKEALVFYRLHENNAHKNYHPRYVGLRGCMNTLRHVAEKMQLSRDYYERISKREAKICESFGVIFFKNSQYGDAYEALSYAYSQNTLTIKRIVMLALSFIMKFFIK